MNSKGWMAAATLLAAGTAQATCYSVHKADSSLILETSSAPVNLTLPVGDTVPEKFGQGAFMVMSDSRVFCKERRVVHETQEAVVAAASVKKPAEVKVEPAVELQPTDEELLALKPEVVEPTAPVQSVEVKVVGSAGEAPAGDAMKAQQQMGAGKLAASAQ